MSITTVPVSDPKHWEDTVKMRTQNQDFEKWHAWLSTPKSSNYPIRLKYAYSTWMLEKKCCRGGQRFCRCHVALLINLFPCCHYSATDPPVPSLIGLMYVMLCKHTHSWLSTAQHHNTRDLHSLGLQPSAAQLQQITPEKQEALTKLQLGR